MAKKTEVPQITQPERSNKMEGSFLDLNFDGVYTPELFDADKEVLLRVSRASLKAKKGDKEGYNIEVVFEDPTNPRTVDVYHYVSVPPESLKAENPKSYNAQMVRLQEFCQAMDIGARFDVEQALPGKEVWAVLRVEDDPQFGKRNSIKRFITKR